MLLAALSGCISYNPDPQLADNKDPRSGKAPAPPGPSVPVWSKAQVPPHYQRDDFSLSKPGATASDAGPAGARPDAQPGPLPDVATAASTPSDLDSIVLAAASTPVPGPLLTPGLSLMTTAAPSSASDLAPSPIQDLKPPPAPPLAMTSASAPALPTAPEAATADPARSRSDPIAQGSNPLVPPAQKSYRVPPIMCVVDNKCITLNLDVRDRGPSGVAGAVRPQVWVMVEPTGPQVQLTDVTPGLDGKIPTVSVRWQASDRNLGHHPVSLSYAAAEEGPWQSIATNLDSMGRFVWRVPPGAPSKLYIRAEATDVAGNVGVARTDKPVLLGTDWGK
jgi:hypothetical protein